MKLLVLNGPNLNLLGRREPAIYGSATYHDLVDMISRCAQEEGIDVDIYQSNHEGDLVDKIQQAAEDCQGIVINPAAYTHTSVAILDAIKAVNLPAIEVHISDVSQREDFRKLSYVRLACVDTIVGMGFAGYLEAMRRLKARIAGA